MHSPFKSMEKFGTVMVRKTHVTTHHDHRTIFAFRSESTIAIMMMQATNYRDVLSDTEMEQKKVPASQSEFLPSSEKAFIMTSDTNKPNARRVSDPEIDTKQHSVLSDDDISVSSIEESTHASGFAPNDNYLIILNQEQASKRIQDSADVSLSTSSKFTQYEKTPNKEQDINQYSYNELFQLWHNDRVGKRRFPSVAAYPDLPRFQVFGDTSVDGYSFGTFFYRWYRKQQQRSGTVSASSEIDSQSPHSRKRSAQDSHAKDIGCPVVTTTAKKKAKSTTICAASSIQQQRNLNSQHKWNAANALFRSEIVELPSSFFPGSYTVIMGRRLKAPGCVHLRSITDQFAAEYKAASSMDKSRIVTRILKLMYHLCPVGAFVRCKGGTYYEVEDLIAREKIVSELIADGLQIVPDGEKLD
jgi:hypothetical protein